MPGLNTSTVYTALGAFYRRMRTRLGAAKAITATAHKLAESWREGIEAFHRGASSMRRSRVMT